jgi:photosystem II protein PsbQ
MARQRSLLSLILVIVTTFFLTWGNFTPAAVAAPSTTAAQAPQIEQYVPKIEALRDRMGELQQLIQQRDWIFVGNFIHGPLAELRLDMNYVTRSLPKKNQAAARQITRDLFTHLVNIDQAAGSGNSIKAASNYAAALADIDKFLQLVPS